MKFKSTWILIAVFGALGAYLYFVDEPRERAREKSREAEGLVLPGFDAERVNEISLDGKRGKIRVRRGDDGHWSAVEPLQDRGDDGKIRSFLEDLKALKADKDVDKTGKDLKVYGLDAPELVIRTAGSGGVLAIGGENPSADSRYVRLDDGPVRLAKNYALTSLLVIPDDLRSKELLSGVDWTRLQSVAVAAGGAAPVKLVKAQGAWRIESPAPAEADPDAAEKLAEKLRWTKISSFLTEDPVRVQAALARGIAVSVGVEGAKSPAVVRFAEVDGAVWGQSEGRAAAYTVEKGVLEVLRAKPAELRRRKPVFTKTWSAEKLRIRGSEGTVDYEKSEGAWRRKGETVRGQESSALQDLLQALEERSASQVIDSPAAEGHYGLDAPAATITLSDSQHGEQVLSVGQRGQTVYARAGKAGAVYVMPPDYASTALALLKASNPQPAQVAGKPSR